MSAAEAVIAARSEWRYRGFMFYARRAIARSFTAMRLLGEVPRLRPDAPLLVVTNHPGWWDPLVFFALNAALFAPRRLFGPMDAAALARYRVLSRLGLFGVTRDSRAGARRFLEVGSGVLNTPHTALWVTAGGGFADVRRRPLALKPGVAHLVRRVPGVQVLPLALEYGFWNEPRPEIFITPGEPVSADAAGVDATAAAIEASLTAAQDRLGVAVSQRDPAAFELLLAGRAGAGGAYDACRRVAAWCRGQRFEAAHEVAAAPAARRR
jgi:1-acyl-sn-glycerol-3-phosphate acyltransferase